MINGAGKGFSVVAQEVRNLATKSAEAAKGIKELVNLAIKKALLGKTNSQNMITGYGSLTESIQKTTTIIQEISTASNEEKQGILLIDNNIKELEKALQENSYSANSTNEIAVNSARMAQDFVKDVNNAYAASWGTFKEDTIELNEIGKNTKNAVEIATQGNWK